MVGSLNTLHDYSRPRAHDTLPLPHSLSALACGRRKASAKPLHRSSSARDALSRRPQPVFFNLEVPTTMHRYPHSSSAISLIGGSLRACSETALASKRPQPLTHPGVVWVHAVPLSSREGGSTTRQVDVVDKVESSTRAHAVLSSSPRQVRDSVVVHT